MNFPAARNLCEKLSCYREEDKIKSFFSGEKFFFLLVEIW